MAPAFAMLEPVQCILDVSIVGMAGVVTLGMLHIEFLLLLGIAPGKPKGKTAQRGKSRENP